jgi:hypothetical protein
VSESGGVARTIFKTVRVAIMQSYFLPYLGYWQLIAAVDAFVVYDNIKYTKKGWINRNRFLLNGKEALFNLPLRKDSDFLDVNQRYLADSFDREALINRFREAYRKAPEHTAVMPVLEDIIRCPSSNLFDYIRYSIEKVCSYLELKTPVIVSSSIDCDHSLKAAERVQAICKALGADTYINPAGGTELYSKEDFQEKGITLRFLQPALVEYPQEAMKFVPWLSIIDVLFFNPVEMARRLVTDPNKITLS